MIPTLLVGDHLFVAKSSYGIVKPFGSQPEYWVQWDQPKPGDVVVFEAPRYVGPNHGKLGLSGSSLAPDKRFT